MEIWKDIEGYEGLYQISDLGRVKSLERVVDRGKQGKRLEKENYLGIFKDKKGYNIVFLCKNNVKKTFKLHRLLAIYFIPNNLNKDQVNHINGIKDDNRLENLEWCNNSENQLHAYKTGLRIKTIAEKNNATVLTREQAYMVKYEHKNLSQRQIAKIYGISQAAVSLIRKGINWAHI